MKISVEFLRAVRRCALRKRVWYKALDGLERGIVNLTINLVEHVKSLRLAGAIVDILDKLSLALKSEFIKHLEAYGYGKMRALVRAAVGLGNGLAQGWYSEAFAQLLTLNNMYNPVGWRQPA